jgi:predicted PurR-regulated permease PerM
MAQHDRALPYPDPKTRIRLAPVRQFALLVGTLIGLYVCYLLALPFLPALAWALAAAVLAAPLQQRLQRRLRNPNFAAAISVLLLGLVVFLPLTLLGHHLVVVLGTGIATIQEQITRTDWQGLMNAHPLLAWVGAVTEAQNVATMFGNVGTWLTNLAGQLVKESVSNAVTLLLTFYFLFYFLRDRRDILKQVHMLSPFTDAETRYLFDRVSDTIHGVIFGTVITATVQGTLGGLIFWVLGLPNPLFWGAVMGLLSIIPILGAFLIWIPAAVYLALAGEWGKAAILAAYGTVVIGGIDNILHPVLAGGRLHLHTVPTFIAIVGGIMLFGASGLILGPLVMAMTVAVLQIWRARALRTGESAQEEEPEQSAAPAAHNDYT